ncbi:MAG TPA: CDP-alcohol phosphatidyltransferase family protein [Rhizomicrobium sp.]
MLDSVLRRRFEGPLAPLAARLAAHKVRAVALTAGVFLCDAAAMFAVAHLRYPAALALLAAAALIDALDGPLARAERATPFGAYLDMVLSAVASAGIAFAFGLAAPERALAAMFLMLGLVARTAAEAGVVRIAAAGLASLLGRAAGLIGKSELFVAFALACLFPDWFSVIAYLLGILCFAAAGSRLAAIAAQPT